MPSAMYAFLHCKKLKYAKVSVKYILARSPDISCLIKMKIHSSCELEDFVETHTCMLCVILPDRAYYGFVSSLRI